jgi:hypothetical protein
MPYTRLRGFIALALGFAMLAPTAAAQSGGMGIERSTGRIICDNDIDDDAARRASDPSYAASRLWDEMMFGRGGYPTCDRDTNDLTPLDGGTWGMSAPFTGADAAGRTADFRLYVLSDAYTWSLGSSSRIEDAGTPVDLPALIGSPEFSARFCASKAVFSLGTASFGGARSTNHRLAGERASTISDGLGARRTACPAGRIPLLFAVNMGQYARPSSAGDAGSAAQRRVIIVAAEDIAIDINLEQALRAGLAAQDVFDGLAVQDYDLFLVEAL